MAIAIALVLIFVLYLIDKHNRWRQAVKLIVGLVVLGIVGASGFYGWQKYQGYREEKQQQIEAAASVAKFDECVSRLKQLPVPKDEAVVDVDTNIRSACYSDSNATTYQYQPLIPLPPGFILDKPNEKSKAKSGLGWAIATMPYMSIVKRCAFNVGVFPCGVGEEGDIAKLNKGDRVQILSDKIRSPNGTEIYEVKFQQWTGWVDASDLSLE